MGIGLNIKGTYKDYPDNLKKIVTTLEFEMSRKSETKSNLKTSIVKKKSRAAR